MAANVVFLVTSGEHSDYGVHYAFSDRELADRIVEHMNNDDASYTKWRVEVFVLNDDDESFELGYNYHVEAHVVRGARLPDTVTEATEPRVAKQDTHVGVAYLAAWPSDADVIVRVVDRNEERGHRRARDHARAVLQRLNDGQTVDQIRRGMGGN